MNQLTYLCRKYKEHFYLAEVDKPRGYQISLILMAAFLFSTVAIGFASMKIALFVYTVLCLFLAVFPYLFPKNDT